MAMSSVRGPRPRRIDGDGSSSPGDLGETSEVERTMFSTCVIDVSALVMSRSPGVRLANPVQVLARTVIGMNRVGRRAVNIRRPLTFIMVLNLVLRSNTSSINSHSFGPELVQ